MGTITLNKFIVKTTTSNATVSAIDGWAMKSTGVTIASVNIDTEALCENRSNSGLPPENRKSNGDISLNVITQTQQSSSKKIRRAFSMPRNPFRWSRKFKTNSTTTTELGCKTSSGLEERSKHGSIVSINSYTTTNLNQNPKKDKILMAAATTSGAVQTTGIVNSSEESTNQNKSESDFTGTSPSITGSTSVSNANNRIFRRSSFRKFLNRIAQHVSSTVNIGSIEQSKSSFVVPFYTGCWKRNEANKRASSQASSLAASDRVPPIGGYQWPPDQTPGVTGLKNHGNTCFMNAVLQCLSHTDILAEYFVLDQYKADLKRRNKINSRKFGTKGELTEQLANVLKALWTCKNESDHSTSFKAVVDRYGSQFRSSTQHDAQEFLFWLLDKVHEDLNTATKRRYKSVKNNYGRPDEVIAAETLANHIRCNNSFVQAVFQAQFRSSLTCPRCKKQSNTFDPFHCISVQLPQLTKQTIFVTVLYVKQHPRQVRYGLTVPAGSPITALRQQLQKDTGIRSNCMVLADINETGFSRVFYDTQPVSTLEGIDTIYCIEVPEMNGVTGATTEVNTSTSFDVSGSSSSSTDLMLLVANVQKKTDGSGVERFGTPFCLQAPRDCSYVELQKKILREMATILKPEVFAYSTPLSDMFQIRLQDPSADPDTYLDPVEHPLLTEMIDMALSVLSSETGPAHIKLLLEWTVPEDFFADLSDSVVEHESVARLRDRKKNDTSLTLEQCLEHYTKAETLSAEDAWRCPHCQQYLPVVKTLGLWSLPDILVVHFKRFRQHHDKGADAAKLTTMVKFPLNSFDMSPHLAKETSAVGAARSSFDSLSSNDCYQTSSRSPWRKTRDSNRSNIFGTSANTKDNKDTGKETRYDLYAVCYHQGDTLETGHYTAACKNPYDHQWYKFDDQRVSKVPSDSIHEEIINNEAYMLFYQRRKTDTVECSGSSSTSSDHWVSKIAVPLPVDRNTGTNAGVNPSQIAVDTISEKISEGSLSPVVVVAPVQKETKLQPSLTEPVKILDSATITDIVLEESGTQQAETKTTVIIEKTDECELVDIEEVEYADQDRSHHVNGIDVSQPNITSPDIDVGPIQFQMDEDLKVVNGFEDLHDTSDVMENISKTKIVFQPEPTTVQVKQHSPLINQKQMKSPPVIQSISFMPIKSKTPSPNDLTMKIKSPKTKPTEACISSSSSSSSSSSRSSRTSMSSPIPDTATATASAVPLSMSASRIASPLPSTKSKLHNHNYPGIPSTKYSGVNNNSFKEALSSSLKNNSSSIIGGSSTGFHDFSNASSSLCLNGSTHSGSASGTEYHCVSLRHSFSTSSNYKLKECSDTLSSMLRNTANTCSKDTLIFIDQQNHSLMEDDDSFLGSRSLWISPVTPHKLITVSPKN